MEAIVTTEGEVEWIWRKGNIIDNGMMLSCKVNRRPTDRPPAGDGDDSRIVTEEVLRNSALFRCKGEGRKVDVGCTLGYWVSESRDEAKSSSHESLEVIIIGKLQVYSVINL